LVVAQSSSEIPEGLMNNPVYIWWPILTQRINPHFYGRLSKIIFHTRAVFTCWLFQYDHLAVNSDDGNTFRSSNQN
jgi:hypothetical protein